MPDPEQAQRFIRAVRDGELETVRALASADPALLASTDPACFGATALVVAVGTDRRDAVDLLLDLGADPDQRNDWWAGGFGVLDGASPEMAAHLLRRGATLTPHAAARLGMEAELRVMLERDQGVIHARGGDGQTPLHFASTPAIADLLLSHGADIEALDLDHHSTPAQWLGETCPPVAAHLASRGCAADPVLAARIGDAGLLAALLAEVPEGVGYRITRERFPAPPPAAGHIYLFQVGEGCTLLHAAAGVNRDDSVQWLLSRGADPHARGGYDDQTPLHAAAWRGATEAVRALLDGGADADAVSGGRHRNEAIGWAIVKGERGVVRLLLERGARVRDVHREDARLGARGAFREFNPRLGNAEREAIERMIAGETG